MTRSAILFTILALTANVSAQEIPWANKFFVGNSREVPAIIVHDFGTVPRGSVVTHRFKVTNIYAVPMEMVEPKPGCSCVSVVDFTRRLEPNETGYLQIKLDTNRFQGVSKQVNLPVIFYGRSADASAKHYQSQADVQVKIVARTDVMMNPGALALGTVGVGQPATKSLELTYQGNMANWQITKFVFDDTIFDVTVEPVQRRFGPRTYTVTASLKSDAPAGTIDKRIALSTNDPTSPVIYVPVSAVVQAAVTVSPDRLRATVEVGKSTTHHVQIRASKPFLITRIGGEGNGVSAKFIAPQPLQTQVITITIAPTVPGAIKQNIVIETNHGTKVNLPIDIVGLPAGKGPADGP